MIPGRFPVGFTPVVESGLQDPCDQVSVVATTTTTTSTSTSTSTPTTVGEPASCPSQQYDCTSPASLTRSPAQKPRWDFASSDSREDSCFSIKISGNYLSSDPPRQTPEGTRPLSQATDSNESCPSSNPRSLAMKGLGPSFGAQARAAELNAATAAKARNNGEDPQHVHTAFPSAPTLAYNNPGPGGFPGTAAVWGTWKPLGSEPQFMEQRHSPNHAGPRATTRAVSSTTATPRAAHPLRNVTTIDAGKENKRFDVRQASYSYVPGVSQVAAQQDPPRHLGASALGIDEFGRLRLTQATATSPSVSQNARGMMRPDDISPSKQEEKQTARGIQLNSNTSRDNEPGSDPFVSGISDYSMNQRNVPYKISGPPGHEYHPTRRAADPVLSQLPSYHSNLPADSHGKTASSDFRRQGTAPHPFHTSKTASDTQSSGGRAPPGLDRDHSQQHAESTPVNSAAHTQFSTPTRNAETGSSERLRTSRSAQEGKKPEYATSSIDGVRSQSHDFCSPSAIRHGGPGESSVAYNTPQNSHLQYAQPSFENPLLPSRFQGYARPTPPYDPNHCYPSAHLSGQHGEHDVFGHLNYHERPVPWLVSPEGAGNMRKSAKNPPPGLPVPDPRQDNVLQPSHDISEVLPDPTIRERHPNSHTDHEGEEHLRRQIAAIAREDKMRRLQAGSDEASANKAEEMTVLLGNILVNLQSYVVGDRGRQAINFADFRDIPEHAYAPSRAGRRTFFDIDPRVDPWMLQVPRENTDGNLSGAI